MYLHKLYIRDAQGTGYTCMTLKTSAILHTVKSNRIQSDSSIKKSLYIKKNFLKYAAFNCVGFVSVF